MVSAKPNQNHVSDKAIAFGSEWATWESNQAFAALGSLSLKAEYEALRNIVPRCSRGLVIWIAWANTTATTSYPEERFSSQSHWARLDGAQQISMEESVLEDRRS